MRDRRLLLPVLLILTLAAAVGSAQTPPAGAAAGAPGRTSADLLTRPELTGYQETSRYDEVMAFMRAMAAASPQIHLTTYGYTYEGRPLPLAVIGAPAATPEAVRATGKTRIYIQGNIHAGEVEGKEAALWLLRSIAKGERDDWFRSVVLLINPIYNADGNERVNLRNRGRQYGPIGGTGQRNNAQDLDLNRDCIKLETPEARSLAKLMTDYDPHVAVDLHTTNGSPHGYYLTYQTSVSPNTSPGLIALARGRLLPFITAQMKAKHGWDSFYYGNFSRQGERAWFNDLDLYKPRYTQTYFGLRNRVGILVETYSYASFEDRIKANYWFLEELVNFAAANGEAIRSATAAADAESIVGKPQAVRGRLVKEPNAVPIVLADLAEERHPYVPDRPMLRRVTGSERVETMPHYATVEATETSLAPRAYLVPAVPPPAGAEGGAGRPVLPGGPPAAGGQPGQASPFRDNQQMLARIVDRLTAHGIRFFRVESETTVAAEQFRIDSSTVQEQGWQGMKIREITGRWEATSVKLPAGSLVVPMDQPLARLAFVLLDARSDDGLMAWGLLDDVLAKAPAPAVHPVLRTMTAVQAKIESEESRRRHEEGAMNLDHIHWLGHATFRLEDGGSQIYIDPWKLPAGALKADVILVTHAHYDHFSEEDIVRIEQPGTLFVAPADVAAKLKGRKVTIAAPGGTYQVGPVKVEATPAYNLNKDFHKKAENWVGYVVTLSNGQRIYHSGDTDAVPEMDAIKTDVALMPCGGTYTMTAAEMAEAANRFKPSVLIPMHWGDIVGQKADAEAAAKVFKGRTVIKTVEK